MSLTPINPTPERFKLIKFSKTLNSASCVLMTRSQRQIYRNDLMDYLAQVDKRIWYLLIITIMGLIIFNYLYQNIFTQNIRIKFWHLFGILFIQCMNHFFIIRKVDNNFVENSFFSI